MQHHSQDRHSCDPPQQNGQPATRTLLGVRGNDHGREFVSVREKAAGKQIASGKGFVDPARRVPPGATFAATPTEEQTLSYGRTLKLQKSR